MKSRTDCHGFLIIAYLTSGYTTVSTSTMPIRIVYRGIARRNVSSNETAAGKLSSWQTFATILIQCDLQRVVLYSTTLLEVTSSSTGQTFTAASP